MARSADSVQSVLFVDLSGFTALTEAHGDEAAAAQAALLRQTIDGSLAPGCRLVKSLGDGAMLGAASVSDALRTLRRLAVGLYERGALLLRAGLDHGRLVEQGGDLYGATVNVAARLVEMARPGQVLATTAAAAAASECGYRTVDLGSRPLRHLSSPVQVFEIDLALQQGSAVVDPVCHMPVLEGGAAGEITHGSHRYWFCSWACLARFVADPEAFAERPTQG